MKNLLMAFFMSRDKNTESMKPIVINTLARAVFFPDGKNLVDKWANDIDSTIPIVHNIEVAELDDNSYKWSCTKFGDIRFQLDGHFRPSIANSPTIIGGNNPKPITITKIDSDGSPIQDIFLGGSGTEIHEYRYALPLPSKFAEGKVLNLTNASINITEGTDSFFTKLNTIHDIVCEFTNGRLFIYVKHYRGVDCVDMSELPYMTADFNITINGLF